MQIFGTWIYILSSVGVAATQTENVSYETKSKIKKVNFFLFNVDM